MAQNQPSSEQKSEVVVLDFEDLKAGRDLSSQIEKAFGPDGLGILAVKGIPNFAELRKDILHISQKFATLPEEEKEKLVHKESYYSVGWSHGKEMMSKDVPDFSKGSYYNNPLHDSTTEDKELIAKYPSFLCPNIWPANMPELGAAFKAMGHCIHQVGILVSQQCDKYVNATYPGAGTLAHVVETSKTPKARMLHYFPLSDGCNDDGDQSQDSWCGWHNDHGSITGLVPAIYFDKDGKEISCPDQKAGLYIRARDKSIHRVVVKPDMLAFQIGETAQITSGGLLQATPHCVRGPSGKIAREVSRDTFVMFMEPMWDGPVHLPSQIDDAKRAELLERWESFLPSGVPKLSSRWEPTMNFAQFSEASLKAYYGY